MVEPGHVSLWHPWTDRPGSNHKLTLWSRENERNFDSIGDIVEHIASNHLYCYCNDILDEQEIKNSTVLIRHDRSRAYISRTGKVVALRLKKKRHSGYFIPATVWKEAGIPGEGFLKNVSHIFDTFGFEALSPASLSEKVLRSTLPERTIISRPSAVLRRTLIDNGVGGRIDQAKIARFYPIIYEYDLNKAYLYFSRSVPSPFRAPTHFYYGEKGKQDDRYLDFASYFIHVTMVCHLSPVAYTQATTKIHPIQIAEKHETREPAEGEIIDRWLWNCELEDCLKAGYTLLHIHSGYGWHENSNFMIEWSDILCEADSKIENAHQKAIAKTMKVGLPGRFLKRPETYTLIHKDERKAGDEPILINWTEKTKKYISDWFIRVEYDLQSAQLTPIGSNILAQCRQAVYRQQLRELNAGNSIIMAYIDSLRLPSRTAFPDMLSGIPGGWKEKILTNVWAVGNQIIPEDELEMKAPGISGKYRKQLYEAYHRREYQQ